MVARATHKFIRVAIRLFNNGHCHALRCPVCNKKQCPLVSRSAYEHPIVLCVDCNRPFRIPERYTPNHY